MTKIKKKRPGMAHFKKKPIRGVRDGANFGFFKVTSFQIFGQNILFVQFKKAIRQIRFPANNRAVCFDDDAKYCFQNSNDTF